MRSALFIFFIMLSFISLAEGKYAKITPYHIVSDSFASAVPFGYCLVKGLALKNGEGIPNAKISTLDGVHHTYTDSLGEYKFLIPSTDTSIFFFKEQYSEIVVWDYSFQSQHVVTLNFYSTDEMPMIISFKPVIYLYSEKEVNVELDLDYYGELTFTYPQLDSVWKVTVNDLGIECNGESYPYLFWEGESKHLNYLSNEDDSYEGEIVGRENVVDFLELKLSDIGFNSAEKTDFITFWGPRLVQSEYVFIQFLLDEDYNSQIAGLRVIPEPDASKRVYMFYSAFDDYPLINCQPQHFKKFERTGFTLLEWGGSEINNENINL